VAGRDASQSSALRRLGDALAGRPPRTGGKDVGNDERGWDNKQVRQQLVAAAYPAVEGTLAADVVIGGVEIRDPST